MDYKLLYILLFFFVPLLSGYYSKKLNFIQETKVKFIFLFTVLLFESPIFMTVLWGVRLKPEHTILPIFGALLTFFGGLIGYIFSVFIFQKKSSKGAFLFASALSNQGYTMGGFICFLLYGEYAYGLSAIFLSYFYFVVYLVAYPIARIIGEKESISIREQILNSTKDIRFLPVVATFIGLFLNLLNIPRPEIMPRLIEISVPIASFLVMFAVGIQVEFDFKSFYSKPAMYMYFVKFILFPLVAYIVFQFIPIGNIEKKVVYIQSIVPVAIYSVIISRLFDLDSVLAMKLFISSTFVFLFIVFPILFWILS